MRSPLLLLLPLTAACAAAPPSPAIVSAAPPTAAKSGTVESEIVAATAAWNRAILAKDMAALRAIMTPDFVLTWGDERDKVPRDAWLENLGQMTLARYVAKVRSVRMDGDTAVAEVTGDWDRTFNGERLVTPFVLRDYWTRRDGRWQVAKRYRVS